MDDIKKSILNTLNERISSPLIGGYIISWILWNYKTVFVLLSTKSIEDKFYFINKIIYHDNLHFIVSGLFAPLIFSLFFIFAFPYPEKLIYKFWHRRKKELRDEKQKIDNEKLLTVAESRDLYEKTIKIESEYYENLEKKDLEIKKLKEIISKNNENPVPPKNLVPIEKPVPPKKIDNLQEMENKLNMKLNITNDELSILKLIFDKGIKDINIDVGINLGVNTLNWNKYKSEKVATDFFKNDSVFKKKDGYSNNFQLKKECIYILLETYN
jgi:hypothetical protein